MAEVEVGGIKFKGGKMLVVLTVLSSAGGALWGGFEFWKDYQNLQQTVKKYTAPDLSGFDKKLAVMTKTMGTVTKEMTSVRNRVLEVQQIVPRPLKMPSLRSISGPAHLMLRPVRL